MKFVKLNNSFNALVLSAFAVVINGSVDAAAAEWKPDKPIEIIVGTGVGGGQDKSARTLQRILQEKKLVDFPVTVVNKPGGGGAVGYTYLNQHAGDGNIIYVGNPTLLTNHIIGRSPVNYTHITPLAILLSESVAVSVRTESPLKSLKDLSALLKKDSSQVSVAVGSSLGSTNHIAMALIAKAAGGDGKKLRTVVFQGGGEAITALLGGHLDVNSSAANNVVPHKESGKLRVLAVASPKRLGGILADVPTLKEQGVNAQVTNWRMVAGPKGMSAAQIAYWDRVLAKLVQTAEWKKDLQDNIFEDTYRASAATERYMQAEYEQFRAALAELGMSK
jgi:putative tricarboxylic transport membrane protein